METLVCALVGVKGNAFVVDIDASKSVGELKEAIVEKKKYDLAASKLELFLARNGDNTWLESSTDAVKKLKKGEKTALIEALTHEDNELQGESGLQKVLKDMPEPSSDQIHVLVVVPPSCKRQRLEWRSTRWGSHSYDPNSPHFLLEREDMDDSGLPPVRLMLYCRPTFHSQFDFLRERVLNEGHLGWILGPPGTGKSTTAMAFASTVNRSEWIVTWIHVSRNMTWRCVRLIGDERKTRAIAIADVDEVLRVDEDTMHHLVLVDGWTADDCFTQLTVKCVEWFLKSNEVKQRRLAFVCSVAARDKIQEDMEILTNAVEFRVWSWTLEEYLDAITDEEVFQNVSSRLDAPAVLPDEESRTTMIESKYYYAGGSCRDMFHFRTATVERLLSNAADALNEAVTVGTTDKRSASSINRLFGMFQRPHDVGAVSPVVSKYAASLIGIRCGPEAIKKFMLTHRDGSNPSLNGWRLEMMFFASLRNGGLALVDAAGNMVDTWGQADIVTADGIPPFPSADSVWIKPERWSQGGYDAVMVCKRTQHVRFVQVASAHKNSFRIEYFFGWLKMLSESPESFEVKTMEIIFVVEQDKLSAFNFTTVTGCGLLVPFGWPKGKETELVRLVGIRGLYNL